MLARDVAVEIEIILTCVELLQRDEGDLGRQRLLDLRGRRRRQQPRVGRHLQHRLRRVPEEEVREGGVALPHVVQLEDAVLLLLLEGAERQAADGVGRGALDQQLLRPLLDGVQVVLSLVESQDDRGHQVVVVACAGLMQDHKMFALPWALP